MQDTKSPISRSASGALEGVTRCSCAIWRGGVYTPVRFRVLSWFFFGSGSGGLWLGGVCASGGRPLTSYQIVIDTVAATTTRTGLRIGAALDIGRYDLGTTVPPAEFHALPITPHSFHGDWNYTLAPVPPRLPEPTRSRQKIDAALTSMLTDPALTGMSRSAFDHLVAISEPCWDALAEAAFQRRFHRPRSYLHPQASSLDHYHRLLTALLRRRRAVTSTLLAQLLNVGRTNPSNRFQDGHRLLDLHRVAVTPLPGAPARTLAQLQARLPPEDDHQKDQS